MTIASKPPQIVFKRLDEVEPSKSITTMLYGASKSGKTWFAGSAGSRQLYIYFKRGQGIATLKSQLFNEKYPNVKPITVEVEDKDNSFAFDQVKEAVLYALDNFAGDIDLITVDEATGFRRSAMWKGLALSDETGRSKTLKTAEARDDFFMPGVQDYGMEMSLVEWWVAETIETLSAYEKHFLMLAHERRTFIKSDKSKTMSEEVLHSIRPGFTGRTFPDDITAYFDNVFYIERVGTGERATHRIRIFGDEILLAGTRYAGAFKRDPDPHLDFPRMVKLIQESGVQKGEFHKEA